MNARRLLLLLGLSAVFSGCSQKMSIKNESWMDEAVSVASEQLLSQAANLAGTGKLPRAIYTSFPVSFLGWQLGRSVDEIAANLKDLPDPSQTGRLRTCDYEDWTCGFFPGSLWYAFELSKDEKIKDQAAIFTNLLYPARLQKNTHDLGFMIGCSYGNALRVAPSDTIRAVMVETADNLIARFDEKIGCIRSWDFGDWNFPVIIDNMMNLELLFKVSELTGDKKYADIAIRHANTTMRNHFRSDFTSWHVVSYNSDGTVECKQTWQGRNDDSAWARGQAWGLYGYTVCYRETGKKAYLRQARRIADMIMKKVTTEDAIPYWDYSAPCDPSTPKDASAAAITASALLDLGRMVCNGAKYTGYALEIMRALSSPDYLAEPDTNCNFVLKHSTGALPFGSEVDTPINYADYYFLESLVKIKKLIKP